MNAGKQTKMLRGAVWACVIPVGLGLIGLIYLVIIAVQPMLTDAPDAAYWSAFFITLPILGCFIFGAPLSAWLACRSLRKISAPDRLSRWRASAGRGVLSASLVQLIWTTIYMISLSAIDEIIYPLRAMGSIFITFFATNLILWLIITLPLSLLCATIFWKVTKFPENTDVF